MTNIKPCTPYVDAVMRAVYDLMNSGPNWDGRIGDVERAVWVALDAAVAAERERCAQLCDEVSESRDMRYINSAVQCAAAIRGEPPSAAGET
jgi:hypothetical protein